MRIIGGRRGPRTGLLALILVTGALTAVAGAPPALAATPAPSCANGSCTVSLTSPGTGQSFTVPAGVSTLSVDLLGGAGGLNNNGGSGGDGAEVTADLTVSAAETLGVDVGGVGGTANSANEGGVNGGGGSSFGGGGGGATDVTSGGTPLLVAGGGGGTGTENGTSIGGNCPTGGNVLIDPGPGGNADNPGGAGETYTSDGLSVGSGGGGYAGTISGAGTGGAGGTVSSGPCPGATDTPGTQGASGSGGTGGTGLNGGGGGGGYFGGGAGGEPAQEYGDSYTITASGGGGGGGSSYAGGAGVSGANVNDTGNPAPGPYSPAGTGNGEASFSYADPIATGAPAYTTAAGQALSVPAASGLLSSTAGTTGPAGDTLTAVGPPGGGTAAGGTVTVNPDGSFSYTAPSGFAGTDSFGYTVTDGTDYATGTATVTVLQAPAFVRDSPPLTAITGRVYGYGFSASGSPAPAYALAAGAPSWLSVNATTGLVSGIPPKGTTSFSYEVTATNTVGVATAGPYAVTVSPAKTADLAAALACTAHLTVGGTGTCTLMVTNQGPDAAPRLTTSVSLPTRLAEVSCSTGCRPYGTVVTWTRPRLASGITAKFTVTVKAVTAGQAKVSASASAAVTDPYRGNNHATAVITINA